MYPFMTRVLLPKEGGGYLIEFPYLPGCMSDGETLEDAIENGKDALQCWIEAAAEDGQEIPEPGSSPTWVQLVPSDVHIQLSKRATAEGMNLSELVASILDQATDDRVKGLRHERHTPLDNNEIRSVSTCFAEVMGSSDRVLLASFHRGVPQAQLRL